MYLPAYCRNCGLIFDSPIYANQTKGMSVENANVGCPRCGKTASILEGVMNVFDDTIDLISGPAWSRETLLKLEGIVRKLEAGNITKPEAIKEASSIDPDASAALRDWLGIGMTFAALMLAVLQFAWSRADVKASLTSEAKREAQVERLIEEARGISRKLDQRIQDKSDKIPQPHPHSECTQVESNKDELKRRHEEKFLRELIEMELADFERRKKPMED